MSETKSAETLYAEAQEFIEASMDQLKQGEEVHMQPLEGMVAALCERINAMPREQAQDYETRLNRLIAALLNVEKELKAQRDNVQTQLDTLGKSHAANKAYAKGGGLRPRVNPAAALQDDEEKQG